MKKYLSLFILLLFIRSSAQPPNSFESRGIGGGGALFAPSINPADHNELFMGCDMTELFHSTDMGGHWSELPFKQIQGGHDSQVQFTNVPNLLYCVDYSTINNVDEMRPMKSTDEGQTWSILSGNPYGTQPTAPLRLFADYNYPGRLVLADYGTIYFSADSGSNFTQIHTCISNGAGNHIAGVFFNGDTIYIGTNDGLIYSTNAGANFSTMATTGITTGESILSFSGAKENGATRFVCLTSTSVYAGIPGSDYWGEMAAIYTMDNASGTWTAKTGGITMNTDYPFFVGMAQNDIDTMYCGGGSSSGAPIVMRSIGGGNWSHVFLSNGNVNIYTGWAGTGGDHAWTFPEAPFGFQVCPNDSRMVIFTDYSCVHVTTDGGAVWHQKYLSGFNENPMNVATPTQRPYHGIGLENTTNWQVLWRDSDYLMSAFSDISGVISEDRGNSWRFFPGTQLNSAYRLVKHPNGKVYNCSSSVHDIYQTTRIYDSQLNAGSGRINVSTGPAGLFTQIKAFSGPVIWIALDPTDTNRLYAAVINSDTTKGGIWKTNNLNLGASATWIKCNNPPRTQGHPFNINILNNGDLVVSFSARKPTSGTSFTQSSGVFYSTDGGLSWQDRTDNAMKYYTKDVVVDEHDTTGSTWYAGTFQAWGSGVSGNLPGLFKTTNKGISWTHILSDSHVNSCTINPSNPNEMYVTTEADGLLYSNNINTASPTFTLVDAYPFRHPVRVFYNPYKPDEIWVSSFGAGMKTGNTGCSLAAPTVSQNGNQLSSSSANSYQWLLNGNPIANATSQNYTAMQSGNYSVQIGDGAGCTATSTAVSITISGIPEIIARESDIRLFPNPANGDVNVFVGENLIGATLRLSDFSGRVLRQERISSSALRVSIADFSSGIYIVKVNGETKKFIKE